MNCSPGQYRSQYAAHGLDLALLCVGGKSGGALAAEADARSAERLRELLMTFAIRGSFPNGMFVGGMVFGKTYAYLSNNSVQASFFLWGTARTACPQPSVSTRHGRPFLPEVLPPKQSGWVRYQT